MNNDRPFSGRIDSIQLLRVIASLGVALHHIQFLYATGMNLASGIHIFFTLSAFLMMYTTQRKPDSFILKRLIRVVPLYWIMTILTYLAATVMPTLLPSLQADIKSLLCSMFFIPYARSGLRIDNTIRPLVGPGWTLYYEVYFTILFALSMKISHKYRGLISGLVLAVAVAAGRMIRIDNIYYSFWTSTYFSDFITGIAVFYVLRCLNAVQAGKSVKAGLTGLAIFAWGG